MLGHKQRFKGYRDYIAQGVDEDLKHYYRRFNLLSVLGGTEFKESAIEAFEKTDPDEIRTALNNKPSVDEIIKLVCQHANTKERRVKTKPKGKRKPDPVRVYAMYACRRYGDASQSSHH